jgi:hypothetical protein
MQSGGRFIARLNLDSGAFFSLHLNIYHVVMSHSCSFFAFFLNKKKIESLLGVCDGVE